MGPNYNGANQSINFHVKKNEQTHDSTLPISPVGQQKKKQTQNDRNLHVKKIVHTKEKKNSQTNGNPDVKRIVRALCLSLPISHDSPLQISPPGQQKLKTN